VACGQGKGWVSGARIAITCNQRDRTSPAGAAGFAHARAFKACAQKIWDATGSAVVLAVVTRRTCFLAAHVFRSEREDKLANALGNVRPCSAQRRTARQFALSRALFNPCGRVGMRGRWVAGLALCPWVSGVFAMRFEAALR
jgi:hypothetical protein